MDLTRAHKAQGKGSINYASSKNHSIHRGTIFHVSLMNYAPA
jgi:hypothetical protein